MLGQSRIWDVKQLPKLAGLVLWMGLAGFSCRPAIRSDLPIVHLTLNHHEVLAEVAKRSPRGMRG